MYKGIQKIQINLQIKQQALLAEQGMVSSGQIEPEDLQSLQ